MGNAWIRCLGILALTAALALSAACGSETEVEKTAEEPSAEVQQTETPELTEEDYENMTPEEQSLAMLRTAMGDEGALCAAASVGPADEYAKSEGYPLIRYCAETYPFMAAIPEENWVIAEGEEMYCIVPCADAVSLTVSEFVLDEDTYTGVPGKTLYESDSGEPVILIGNVSDIVPSFIVTVKAENGNSVEYSPCLSLKDGALNIPEGAAVYDFTLYNYEGPGSMAPFMPEKLPGDWASFEVYDAEGCQYTMGLTFGEDGSFEMWYSEPMGDILERYQGQYYEANGVGEEGRTGEDNVYQYEITAVEGPYKGTDRHGAFEVDMWNEGDTIAAIHRDGDPLFYGYDREDDCSLVFDRAMG